jgi:hypothetical protein
MDDRIGEHFSSVAAISRTSVKIELLFFLGFEIYVAIGAKYRMIFRNFGIEAARRSAVIERSDPNVGVAMGID